MKLNYNRIGCTGISYDGVNLSDVFEVVDVHIPLLPTFEAVTQELAQRPGAYFASRKVGTREITMKLRLNAESRCPLDIFQAWREYSQVFNKPTPRKLMLNEEKYCYALMVGDTPIEDEAYYGTVELSFVCYDPYFYGEEHAVPLTSSTSFEIKGGVSCYPTLELTATGSSVTVTNQKTAEFVKVSTASGTKLVIDMERQIVTEGGEYVPVDLSSDFFPLEGSCSLKLTGATGTMKYRERFL